MGESTERAFRPIPAQTFKGRREARYGRTGRTAGGWCPGGPAPRGIVDRGIRSDSRRRRREVRAPPTHAVTHESGARVARPGRREAQLVALSLCPASQPGDGEQGLPVPLRQRHAGQHPLAVSLLDRRGERRSGHDGRRVAGRVHGQRHPPGEHPADRLRPRRHRHGARRRALVGDGRLLRLGQGRGSALTQERRNGPGSWRPGRSPFVPFCSSAYVCVPSSRCRVKNRIPVPSSSSSRARPASVMTPLAPVKATPLGGVTGVTVVPRTTLTVAVSVSWTLNPVTSWPLALPTLSSGPPKPLDAVKSAVQVLVSP